MRRWSLWLLILVVLGVFLLRMTVLAPRPVLVKTIVTEKGRVEATVTNTKAGTIRARRRAKLSAEVGGRVVEISHREGERVKKDAPLIRLNDATQRAQLRLAREGLRAARASRRQACVTRDRARRELERKRTLAERDVVSADVLDQLESAYASTSALCSASSAEVDRATAQIAAVEVELEKLVIRAPFDGIIAETTAELGEWITPSPPLLTAPAVVDVIDPTSIYVSAPMDEVDSAAIHVGQRAKVTVDSHPGAEYPGQVARVAPYVLDIEAQNRTVEIEVELDDRELATQLLPGTSADVEVVLEAREQVLRLPASALFEDGHVLIVVDGELVERNVRIGLRNWDYVEVLEGLSGDERVAVSLDRAEVKAGARVEVDEIEYRP